MQTALAIPIEQYLNTSYRPDCDYVDGELLERNVGEWDHSRLQMLLSGYLLRHEKEWGIVIVVEQRVQVKPTRFRVPDIIAVAAPALATPIVREPPLLCVEILSPDDRMREMQERIEDYLTFGVPCAWIIDPRTRHGFIYTADGMREAKDGILRAAGSGIVVPLTDLEA
jgi:Uma2 family endonuclease